MAALVGCARLCAALDLDAGGTLEAGYALGYGSLGGEDHATLSAKPLAAVAGGAWEARLAACLAGTTDPAKATIELEEARVRLWLGDYLTLAAGCGQEEGTAAEVFPQTAFLGPEDPLSRLESGGGASGRMSEATASIKLAGPWWRASFEYAPFEPELVLPSLDSPWFPSSLVPERVAIGSSTTFLRSKLAYFDGTGPKDPFVLDPSYIAKTGASIGPMEIDLEYFQGLERQAILTGIISTVNYPYNGFDALLVPHRAQVRSLALAGTVVAGAWRFWTEDAYTWEASLATGSAAWDFSGAGVVFFYPSIALADDPITATPPLVHRDRVACTLGSSFNPELGNGLSLFAFAEATWSWYLDAPAGSPTPSLSRAAAGSVSLSGVLGRLGFGLSGLLSLADWSAAIRPSASLDLGGDKALGLAFPLFLGGADSELGCYSGKRFALLSFTQKF